MDHHSATSEAPTPGRWWGPTPTPSASTDVMNQLCRVCGEPAAGFHFGAFTCEGCKSFFGRTYNNLSSISECKNNGECVINKKNRTSCKACRLRKCLMVGMSKSGSRYGRRSNWFKIHCLLQEQQQNQQHPVMPSKNKLWDGLSYPAKHHNMLDVDNNNSTIAKEAKDRSLSPMILPPGYGSAEAAAALWAARGSLLPVHPHHPSLPFFAPPIFHNATFHQHPPTNFLLPFMPPRLPPPEPALISSSSSSSSNSSPGPIEDKPVSNDSTSALETFCYDKSIAVLRSLGPVQDSPMDLSFRNCRQSASDLAVLHDSGEESRGNDSLKVSDESSVKDKEDSGKKLSVTPLDLTCTKT